LNALAPRTNQIATRVNALREAIQPCGREMAARYATVMLGGYTDLKVMDPKTFAVHLEALFADYPQWLCEIAQKEIPRTIPKYKLDMAGIREWMEERMSEKRREYGEAVERQRKAEADAAEAEHRAQVERDRLAFKAWEADHPGGTLKQYLGFEPYRAPSEAVEDDTKPCEMGPYTVGALARRLVGDVM